MKKLEARPGISSADTERRADGAPAAARFGIVLPPIVQGELEARFAACEADIAAAQALRYRVFYEEMRAKPSPETAELERDMDRFDEICDHILVTDRSGGGRADGVVGTYRLLRRSIAERSHGFYTSGEYDISCLERYEGELLELGRSCVAASYRTLPTMKLLWRAIAAYVFRYDIALMFGCASLPGTDPAVLGLPLSYLHYHHLAPPALRPRALEALRTDMRILPRAAIDQRAALAATPPLIKGYLRLGGFVGDGAVVDPQFNTTDVSIIVKTDLVTERYLRHYERERP